MRFQDVLITAQDAEPGRTVLFHCENWPDIIWTAFKYDEKGKPICTIFIKRETGEFSVVNGARFTQFEIADIASEWEIMDI